MCHRSIVLSGACACASRERQLHRERSGVELHLWMQRHGRYAGGNFHNHVHERRDVERTAPDTVCQQHADMCASHGAGAVVAELHGGSEHFVSVHSVVFSRIQCDTEDGSSGHVRSKRKVECDCVGDVHVAEQLLSVGGAAGDCDGQCDVHERIGAAVDVWMDVWARLCAIGRRREFCCVRGWTGVVGDAFVFVCSGDRLLSPTRRACECVAELHKRRGAGKRVFVVVSSGISACGRRSAARRDMQCGVSVCRAVERDSKHTVVLHVDATANNDAASDDNACCDHGGGGNNYRCRRNDISCG
jgi:hypothetical protein